LHDGKAGDVSVLVGAHEFKLHAGEQLIVTDDAGAGLKQANPVPGVAIRYHGDEVVTAGVHAFVCEFSLPSAIAKLNTLSALSHSADSQDRALYARMLKNAAVLQVVTAGKGPYKAMR
jgi:hypothetical protein